MDQAVGAGPRSAALFDRARAVIPGGVNSPVRAMGAIGRDPIFVERGDGAELIDADGGRYIDWVQSWGPLIAGHARPEVVEAVSSAARRGTSYGAPTQAEVELAEEIVRRVPSAEIVRMTSSGTEATMSALRLARAATGRDAVLKFAGGYHGHVDGLLADAGSGLATQGIPASPGVTTAQAADTVVARWNDRRAVEEAIEQRDLAAIVCEPCPANMGVVPAEAGFLEWLRGAANASGALLVFDEVISGFRVGPGGVQERAGVMPDITVLGKVIGGGLPAAAYAGRADVMERIAPAGDVYQAGTLSGNPLATAAGLASLRLLDSEAYARLDRTTERLATGLQDAARETGVAVQVPRITGLLTVFFSADPVRELSGAQRCDLQAHAAFCRALLDRGVYPPPSQFEAWFPSLAHGDDHVDTTVEAAREAFAEL
ncbi:MAG: glutamate-1-semialdehyde 2,1-aminomutase [Actinobacteria bacterium]|nr:glutamate-1-semialdehyde 2,1-aminomutase [Actinomycetota bacterium]